VCALVINPLRIGCETESERLHQKLTHRRAHQNPLAIYFRLFEDRDCFSPARAAFSNLRACCFLFSANRAALVSYLIFFVEAAFFLDVPDVLSVVHFEPWGCFERLE